METTHTRKLNTLKNLSASLITAIIIFGSPLASSQTDDEEWTDCVAENEICIFEGKKTVRYGGNDLFAYGVFENQVLCGNTIFGDPAPGIIKRCSHSSSINQAPEIVVINSQYTLAGETVSLDVIASDPESSALSYTVSGLPFGLSFNSTTSEISGSTDLPGNYNVSIKVTDAAGAQANLSFPWVVSEPSEWIICAAENEFCHFSGIREVRYGAGPNLYHYGEFIDGVACGNSTFSDPAQGTAKSCYYKGQFVPFSVTAIPNREGFVGRQTSLQVSATSSSTTFNFQSSDLPIGLSLNPSTGLISGTPDTDGVYTPSITVNDGLEEPIVISFDWEINTSLAPPAASTSSSLVYEAVSAGNDRVWVANPDNNTISVFDVTEDLKIIEIAVGNAPQSIALIGDEAWVVNRDSATISIINTLNYSLKSTVNLPVHSQPHGIVADGVSEELFVTLTGTEQVIKIDLTSQIIMATLEVGQNVRGLAIDESGNYLYASRFITPPIPGEHTATPDTSASGGQLLIISLADFSLSNVAMLAHSEKVDGQISSRGIPNYLGSMAISPDGSTGWVPSKQDNIKRGKARDNLDLNHENSVRAISSQINLGTHIESYDSRLDLDNASLASAAIFHPTSNFLFVALETSREVAVVNLTSGKEIRRISAGRAPQALAISPSGDMLFVHNYMDRSVTRHNVAPLIAGEAPTAPALATYAAVDVELLDPVVLQGKQLFYDAADTRLAREGYLSCASCHNDGGHDGRVWDLTGFGEGMRNTIPLKGRGGMNHGPLHWTGNFDEIQDFEGQIRALAGGTGLIDDVHFDFGTRDQPLGDTKAGFSSDLDAIAVYLSSLTEFPDSPYRESDGSLSPIAQSGKDLFAQSGCVDCHSGTAFTDSGSSTLHNVGTENTLSGSRLDDTLTGFDTPTLRGLLQSAPYLHDGSALSLQDAIRAHNGATLSPGATDNIAAYLLEIDSREAGAPLPSEWQLCASERQTCSFEGTRQVRYGNNGLFNYGTFDGSVLCRNTVFGDPIPGTVKFCYYKTSSEISPRLTSPGLQSHAIDNDISLLLNVTDPGDEILSFKASGLPSGLNIDESDGHISGVPTSSGHFNVTISLVIADDIIDSLSFSWTITDPSDPDSEWIYCANERGHCVFLGEADVRYGANNTYSFGVYSDGVACTNIIFGDPTPGVAKTCEYRSIIASDGLLIDDISDQTSELGGTVSLQVLTSNIGAGSLIFSAINLPPGLTINETSGLISGTLNTEAVYLDIEVTITDADNDTSSSSFTWTVSAEPIIGDDDWLFCANEKGTCAFSGIKEVRYGSEVNYFYGIHEDSVICSNAAFGDPTPGIAKSCSYRVSGNTPPVIDELRSTVSAVGTSIALSVVAVDPDGEDVFFTASGLPNGISIDANTGEFLGSPTTVSIFNVFVTATDASGASSEAMFTWTVQTEVIGTENWVLCAAEGDICNFDGEQKVYFGAEGQFDNGFFTDSVLCARANFDDPIAGVAKSCYYEIDPSAADWTFCVDQDDVCVFDGTKLVRFGAERAFNHRVATSSIACTEEEFGDPLIAETKRCEVKDIDSEESYTLYPSADEDQQWVYCSPNGLNCHFPGTKQVRYILGDEYTEITATDSVFCSESSFLTDPVVDAKKTEHCEVLLNRSDHGEWSSVISWPLVSVSASLLPDGRLLTNNATNDDLYTGYADITAWDPGSNTFSLIDATSTTFAEQSSEMFCSGFDLMPDGNMLIAGSEPNLGPVDNLNASRYDYRTERFSRVSDNEFYRYYPSMTTTPTGDMVTFAGTLDVAPLEIFKFDGTWDTLEDTKDTLLNDYTYYAWGQTAPNGQLFYPGPSTEMKYFDLRGEGEEIPAGSRDTLDRDYGSYALYDIGKILITGGAQPATGTTALIDINGPSPVVTSGANMGMPRRHGNLTILADGSLLKTGGHTGSTPADFEPDKAVYSAEIWSPETGQWTTMASMHVNRLYHSTAVLLPDGRVFSGGTGYPFDLIHNQSNAEIFSPPYLFNADGSLAKRPDITRAPESVGYDHNFTIDIDSALPINKVHIIKLGTVTHHQNFGQRLVPLAFEQNGNELDLVSPEGANIAPPGYYMLIVIDAQGRPSVSKMLQVLPHPTVNIRSASTGFVLDIAEGDTYENAFASLGADNANLSQMWSIQTTDNGYFKFISRASGYALTNMEGVLGLGSDTGSVEEHWRFVEAEANGGYYALQSRSDNLYLSADMSNPGQLMLSDNSTASTSTQWQIIPVGDINVVAELTGHLLDAGDTQYGSSEVFVERNEGTIAQAWYFEAAEDGYSSIRARSGNKALALSDSGAGSDIVQESFVNEPHQHWRLVINNDGSFKIESRSSQLPVANNGPGSGLSQVGVSDNSEAWRIVPAVSGQPENTSEGGGQILYRTLVEDQQFDQERKGYHLWKTNGQTSGNTNLDKAVQTLQVHVNGIRDGLSIEYQVFDEITGWSTWASDGAIAGEVGESIFGLRARLTGENQACSLRYRVYNEINGWTTWSNAEGIAGSEGSAEVVNGVAMTASCQAYISSAPSSASAKLSITANQQDINYSSYREDAFEVVNTSATQKILKVEINLSNTSLPNIVFDPIGLAGDPVAACFDEGSGGLETGFLIPIDACIDPYGLPKDGGYSLITLEFNDFEPGESFSFGGDIDPTSIKNAINEENEASARAVSGLELSGASVTIYFDDGTTMSNDIFPDGSNAGAQSCLGSNTATAPVLSLSGGAEIPSISNSDALSLDVFAEANSEVKLFVLEAALFGVNGFDIDPFESNSVVQIREYLVVTDNTGSGFIDIELTQTSSSGGYNHIIAASKQGLDVCTSNMTKFGVVQYSP